jgi:hypothetical protein
LHEIGIGDQLFDEQGHICTVTFAGDVQWGHPCYHIKLSDGADIVADADHKWFTMDIAERLAVAQRTSEFREARKKRRPKRGTGARTDLAVMNVAREYDYLDPPAGSMRTTKEIFDTCRVRGRTNHSIAVHDPLDLPLVELPIDPWILGAWLGDGSSYKGEITSADAEILEGIAEFYDLHERTEITYGVYGLVTQLRALDLLANKHIPPLYLRAHFDDRLALLQGLMDTDGYCDPRGQCEFTTTKYDLAAGVYDLLWTLGIKVNIVEGRAMLGGKDCGPKYRIKFLTSLPAFRLPRKLLRQKRDGFRGTHERRYVVSVREWHSVPVKCIAVDSPSHLFLAGRGWIPTHNTDLLLGLAFTDHQRSILFRRTYPELEDIIDRTMVLCDSTYYRSGAKRWDFPNGVQLRLRHLEKPRTETRYQGHAYDGIFFDELTHFNLGQYLYLFSRNRTTIPGQRCRVYSASNPGGEGSGWVIERWAAWLDPAHPDPALPGEIRWYVQTPSLSIPVEGPEHITIAGEELIPKSRTFIPATLADNPYLGDAYRANLQAQPEPIRSQLLYGDWGAGAQEDVYQIVPRAWLSMAVDRWREWDESGRPLVGLGSVGVDVGRGGDVSVIAPRRGSVILELVVSAAKNTMEIVRLAREELEKMPRYGLRAVVDVLGVGAGVVDRLEEIAVEWWISTGSQGDPPWRALAFNAANGWTPTDRTGLLHFANPRAAAWWGFRERLDPDHNPTLCIPPDEMLFAELTAPKWTKTSSGLIIVESKDAVKKRLSGRSTDRADAVIQALYDVDDEVLMAWG